MLTNKSFRDRIHPFEEYKDSKPLKLLLLLWIDTVYDVLYDIFCQ